MKREYSSSPVRDFFGSKVFLLFAFLLTLAFAFGFARAYFKDYAFREEVKNLEEELARLEKKKIESLELLTYVSSTGYLEDAARLELNMKRPGERVLFIESSTEAEDMGIRTSKSPTGGNGQELSNPVKWWYYFTHRSP